MQWCGYKYNIIIFKTIIPLCPYGVLVFEFLSLLLLICILVKRTKILSKNDVENVKSDRNMYYLHFSIDTGSTKSVYIIITADS